MISAGGLITNLKELVTDSSLATVILLVLGLMLIIVEFFQPARGIPSYCGIVLVICGIVVRMLNRGSFIMMFYMLFGCAVILLVAHVLCSLRPKKAWLTQSLAIKLEKAMNEEEIDYENLIDKVGTATTDIDEYGHVAIGDVNLYVSGDAFIKKGSSVRVVRVSDEKIEVEAVEIYTDE